MKMCFEIDDNLPGKEISEIRNAIVKLIDVRTKHKLVELKYTLPDWFESKKELPILTHAEIKELLVLGFVIEVTWGADDCHGYSIRIELIDPNSALSLWELYYLEGWEDEIIKKILKPLQEYKCDKIIIKEMFY